MRIIKKENQFGLQVYIKEEDSYLSIYFAGNYDLYWSIHSNNRTIENDTKSDIFIITKENNDLYNTFEKLYYDIEEINLYEEDDKDKYRLYNYSNYQELFDLQRLFHETLLYLILFDMFLDCISRFLYYLLTNTNQDSQVHNKKHPLYLFQRDVKLNLYL